MSDAKPTPTELAPQYEPKAVEGRIYDAWESGGYFHAEPDRDGPPYTIVIPPPNVTGALHMGHGLDNALQDILVRWRRMQGYNALWMPGTDHAGIATQTVVEKRLLAEEGKKRHEVGREELVRRIWQWKDDYEARILNQLKLMGCSCDWQRTRFTLDETCARAVRHTFFRLFRDGLIYRGKRLVNWDPATETTLADDEVEYETVQGHFWHIRYPLSDGSGHVVVATTRPETMLGDTAVAVNPQDERFKDLVGKTVRLPLADRDIPIIADDYVSTETGTGCLKVTPAHDPNDWAIGQRNGLPLVNILNPDGTINAEGGPYEGLDRFEARKRVVADLDARGLVEKVEPYVHEVGHSYRSHVPIEPYLSDQWYVAVKASQRNLSEDAAGAVRDGRVRFHPDRYGQTYLAWLDGLRDWPISRQIWWGHRIPIWYAQAEVTDEQVAAAFIGRDDVAWRRDEETGRLCLCPLEGEFRGDELGDGVALEREVDVLDTWFSSALWPHSTLGWPAETAELERYYPTSTLVTARDIITLWVSRMVMMGLYNVGEVPFADVFIHATILDGQGQRMSKSKGNGIDPIDVIDAYGADAMRFTLAQMTTESQDIRMPVETDEEGRLTSRKFEIGRNFCNKFWNAARFIFMNLEGVTEAEFDGSRLELEDRWILSRLSDCVRGATDHLEAFRFHDAVETIYNFMWNEFCDWYLEVSKARLSDPEARAIPQRVLAYGLDRLLRLLHPFVPYLTEELWGHLNKLLLERGLDDAAPAEPSAACIVAHWPEPVDAHRDTEAERDFALVQATIRAIRNIRSRMNIPPRTPVTAVIRADAASVERIGRAAETIRHLAAVEHLTADADAAKPKASATEVVESVEVFVPLEGVVDLEQERERLRKRIAEQEKLRAGSEKKLANEKFVTRAKPEVVQAERDRLERINTELETLEANLADLE